MSPPDSAASLRQDTLVTTVVHTLWAVPVHTLALAIVMAAMEATMAAAAVEVTVEVEVEGVVDA